MVLARRGSVRWLVTEKPQPRGGDMVLARRGSVGEGAGRNPSRRAATHAHVIVLTDFGAESKYLVSMADTYTKILVH
jgi:hypothetical protein